MRLARLIHNFIFGSDCVYCGEMIDFDTLVCDKCKNERYEIGDDICEICGREHEFCNCDRVKYEFKRCVAPFYYEGAAKNGIKMVKFQKLFFPTDDYGKKMAKCVRKHYKGVKFDYVLYVPMLKKSELDRGFNQSRLLAEAVAKYTGIKLKNNILYKIANNKCQHSLALAERKENVKGVYSVKHREILKDKTVLLVDDIFTTGATLSECALILKKNGVKDVYCVAFCSTKLQKLEIS